MTDGQLVGCVLIAAMLAAYLYSLGYVLHEAHHAPLLDDNEQAVEPDLLDACAEVLAGELLAEIEAHLGRRS